MRWLMSFEVPAAVRPMWTTSILFAWSSADAADHLYFPEVDLYAFGNQQRIDDQSEVEDHHDAQRRYIEIMRGGLAPRAGHGGDDDVPLAAICRDSRRALVSKPPPGKLAGDDVVRLAFLAIVGMRGERRRTGRRVLRRASQEKDA
jgi:hypothetical protein